MYIITLNGLVILSVLLALFIHNLQDKIAMPAERELKEAELAST
jgi:hypothetical protein